MTENVEVLAELLRRRRVLPLVALCEGQWRFFWHDGDKPRCADASTVAQGLQAVLDSLDAGAMMPAQGRLF